MNVVIALKIMFEAIKTPAFSDTRIIDGIRRAMMIFHRVYRDLNF